MPEGIEQDLVDHLRRLTFEERVGFMARFAEAYRDWLNENGITVDVKFRAKAGEPRWVDKRMHSSRRG